MHLRSLTLVLLLLLLVAPGAPLRAAEEATPAAEGEPLASYRELLAARSTATRLEGLGQLLSARPEGAAGLLEEFMWDSNEGFRRSVLDALVMMEDAEALAVLDRALADEDPALRADAVRAITAWPGEVSLQRLRRAATDEKSHVVVAAVEGLTNRKAVGQGDLLVPLLEREDEHVLLVTALAFRQTTYRKAIPALTRVAELSTPTVAVPATETIARLGGPEAVSALIYLSGPGLRPELRRAAVRGLARNPSERVTEHLLGIAALPKAGAEPAPTPLRREAVAALAEQGDFLRPRGARVVALLQDPDAELRRAVLRLLYSVPLPEAAGPARALSGDRSRDPEERTLALRVLATSDAKAAGQLAATIARESEQLNARIQAVELLGSLAGEAGPRTALLDLAAGPDPEVSALALESLRGRIGAGDAAAVARAASSEDPGVRVTVCDLLGEAGSPEALPALTSLMDDPEPAVRQAAAASLGSLGKLGGDAARKALSAHRMDPDAGVRSAVRQALARLGPGT